MLAARCTTSSVRGTTTRISDGAAADREHLVAAGGSSNGQRHGPHREPSRVSLVNRGVLDPYTNIRSCLGCAVRTAPSGPSPSTGSAATDAAEPHAVRPHSISSVAPWPYRPAVWRGCGGLCRRRCGEPDYPSHWSYMAAGLFGGRLPRSRELPAASAASVAAGARRYASGLRN